MKRCNYACGSADHLVARRRILGGLAAGAAGTILGGLGVFTHPAAAAQLQRDQKRMLVIRMAGGLSQLESWDPKPGTTTGGPFRAIPTSVPGIQISELLPRTARQMHHLALLRGVNTSEDDHGKGHFYMMTGRRKTPASDYPEMGAVVAKALEAENASLPGHIVISPGGGGGRSADSAYLGPRYASIVLGDGNAPQHTERPQSLSEDSQICRSQLREAANDRFALRRRTAETEAYTQSFDQARELMREREIFDLGKEPEKDHERYGSHDFGRHCLMARRLLENGITFVQVTHSNYDTHNENFNFHFEQLGEFDGPFAALIGDLADRGMLDSTLVVVLSEFGRTPNINRLYGRDHWSRAWSVCLAGAGIQRGVAVGATNETGTEVTETEANAGDLFHTYLEALGLSSTGNFLIGGQKIPLADPACSPVHEILA